MSQPSSTTPSRLFSRSEIAEAFGVTPHRITKWTSDGMPVADRGARGRQSRYNLRAVVAWEVERRVQARGGGRAGAPIDLALERAKLARELIERARIENDVRRKALLPRDQVVRDGKAFVIACRAKLLALPSRLVQLGHVLVEKQTSVKDLVCEALLELSRMETVADCRKATRVAKGGSK